MNWPVILTVGMSVVGLSVWLITRHRARIRSLQADQEFSPNQKKILLAQQNRRQLASSLLLVVGLLIPALAYAMDPLRQPLLSTFLMLLLLILLFIIFVLAIGDMIANRALRGDVDIRKAETELKRRVIEQEIQKQREVRLAHERAQQNGRQKED